MGMTETRHRNAAACVEIAPAGNVLDPDPCTTYGDYRRYVQVLIDYR
jgi:hypothetical protein